MTDSQKREIASLRAKSNGYGKIAPALGISLNTVKPCCRRNNIGVGSVSAVKVIKFLEVGTGFCECCGNKRYNRFSDIKQNGSARIPAGTNG